MKFDDLKVKVSETGIPTDEAIFGWQ